jgi:hypothetical protein
MGEIQMSRKFNAILGLGALAAFGFASSAFAQCPTGPVPPWTSQSALGGAVAIVAGGFDGTSCRMDSTITTNGPGVNAFVRDNTPATEPRYRAQFIINVDSLTGLNSIQSSKIFGATSDTAHLSLTDIVRMSVFGNLQGTSKVLGILTVCEGAAGNQCAATTALAAGENRVEIDWNQADGTLDVWVNSGVEATPTVTLTGNSSNWAGVDYATLGLSSPSPSFRTAHLNRAVGFDEFDSRRTSFIGE